MYGAKNEDGHGKNERDGGGDEKHASPDGQVNSDEPADGRCRHGVGVNGVFCYS